MKKSLLILFVGIFLFSLTSVSADLETGLIDYYTLDETSGTTAEGCKGNDATANDPRIFTTEVDGVINTGADFQERQDYIALPTTANAGNTFTISFWFKGNSNDVIFNRWVSTEGDDRRFALRMDSETLIIWNGTGWNNVKTGIGTGWYHVVAGYDGSKRFVYVDGVSRYNQTKTYVEDSSDHWRIGYWSSGGKGGNWSGVVDEVGVWGRVLSLTEVETLYNSGDGARPLRVPKFEINLISPENEITISKEEQNFTADFNIKYFNEDEYVWKNATFQIWKAGEEFNFTTVELSGNSTSETVEISDLELGNYEWNVEGWYGNDTYANYTTSENNYTLVVGASLNSINYNSQTYETERETFEAEFEIVEDSEISLAQLVYSNETYAITNLTIEDTILTLSKTIDIPTNTDPADDQTNEFYFKFTYGGGEEQTTETFEQNVSFINLVLCGGSYTTETLQFNLKDELSDELVDTGEQDTTLEAFFMYWLGDGEKTKNYSYSQILGTKDTFKFCLHPTNETLYVDMDLEYEAENYTARTWYLRNASITNETSEINLYLLLEEYSVKFFLQVRQGADFVEDAIVTISKYVLGEGGYRTISKRKTDELGEFVEYLDLDKDYEYSITKDGVSLGVVDRQGSCTESPCEMDLQLSDPSLTLTSQFATNVVYDLDYYEDKNKVIFTFEDTTGLAEYFRLIVRASNQSTICDRTSYSTAGSLECDMGNYTGSFEYEAYISRSPETLVDFGVSLISSIKDIVGDMGVLFSLMIIVTVAFVGFWNPAVGVALTTFAVAMMYLLGFIAIGWTTVVLIIVMGGILIVKIRT